MDKPEAYSTRNDHGGARGMRRGGECRVVEEKSGRLYCEGAWSRGRGRFRWWRPSCSPLRPLPRWPASRCSGLTRCWTGYGSSTSRERRHFAPLGADLWHSAAAARRRDVGRRRHKGRRHEGGSGRPSRGCIRGETGRPQSTGRFGSSSDLPGPDRVRIAEMPLWLFRWSLRPQGLLGAIDERLLFGGGESGSRVHGKVEPRWHVPLIQLGGDVFGVPLGAIPFGKIQMAAAAIHVSLEKPGYGRNVGVPGPHGIVAMAVKAGAAEQCPGVW